MSSPTPAVPASPATLCVHAGHRPSLAERSLVSPIVRSTAYVLDEEAYALRAAGRSHEAWIYTRERNPTQDGLEARLAALEGADGALAFASGMAALHALFALCLKRGDRLVVARQLYGGSAGLLAELSSRMGFDVLQVDVTDLTAVERGLSGEAALLFVESVANPTLEVADLPRLAELAHAAGARFGVDATFVTPLGQRPLALGADVVMHSASKYLGGHDDLLAGVLAADAETIAQVRRWRTLTGACLDPQASFLLDRGLKTLHLRMRAHAENARAVVEFLAGHARVTRVLWPGLASHPTHDVAERVLESPGGMVSFSVEGGGAEALRVAGALTLFLEAGTLGGVESLVSVPAAMSHVALTPDERLAAGIEPGLLRLSVGVEEADDLIADLAAALGAWPGPARAAS